MLHAFQSASAPERLAQARDFLRSLPAGSEVAIVGNSRSSADDFVRGFACERQATVGLHRFSMVQFAMQVGRAEIARRSFAPLTATGAVALAVRSVF